MPELLFGTDIYFENTENKTVGIHQSNWNIARKSTPAPAPVILKNAVSPMPTMLPRSPINVFVLYTFLRLSSLMKPLRKL